MRHRGLKTAAPTSFINKANRSQEHQTVPVRHCYAMQCLTSSTKEAAYFIADAPIASEIAPDRLIAQALRFDEAAATFPPPRGTSA
jgi:hypothetical protein